MGKEKASAALFDQLQAAIEGGEGDDIVGKMKVRSVSGTLRYKNIRGIPATNWSMRCHNVQDKTHAPVWDYYLNTPFLESSLHTFHLA